MVYWLATPPDLAFFSTTSTRRPCTAREAAVDRPPSPAPITTAS